MLERLISILTPLLISKFLGPQASSSADSFDWRKIQSLTTKIGVGLMLLVSCFFGLFILAGDLLLSSHEQSKLTLTGVGMIGLGIALISVVATFFNFQKIFTNQSEKTNLANESQAQVAMLASALSALIFDFIEERNKQKANKKYEPSPYRFAQVTEHEGVESLYN
jgi:hypothetical protein